MDPLTAQAKLIFERDEARERVKELEQEADISITGGGMYSQERYDQCLETKDNALGDMGYASGKLQLKYREHPAPDINWDELEWAVCDALLNEGTIIAWPGDGVSCVAQMINAQHERAITAEHSQVTTKLCLDTKVEQYDKLRQLQMKTFEENERLREALELIADDWPQAPFGSKNREYANGFNAGVSSCGEDVEEIARLAIAGGYAVGKLIPTLQAKRKVAYQISMDKYLKEKDNE